MRWLRGRTASLLLKAAILIIGAIGQWDTLMGPGMMQGRALMYFTTQSNLIGMALALVFLLYELGRARRGPPMWLWRLKYMATVAITLTYLVFHLLLIGRALLALPREAKA